MKGFVRLIVRWAISAAAVAVAAWIVPGISLTGNHRVWTLILVALVLGIQPLIAHKDDGTPLFFPFGLGITLPAILLPHIVIGIAEAVLTVLVWRYARARKWILP